MSSEKKKKPIKNYVDNKKFYEVICKYKEDCRIAEKEGRTKPRIPEYAGKCILDIANHYSYHPWFANWSFKDEMILNAVENCLVYFDNFDETKYTNPFAYFSRIVYFAFQRYKRRERKLRYKMYKNFENTMLLGGQAELMIDSDNPLQYKEMYDNIYEFMGKYEEDEAKNKKKKSGVKNEISFDS